MLGHWNANWGYYRQSDHSGMAEDVTRALRTADRGGRCVRDLRATCGSRTIRWRLHVLAHPHGPRVRGRASLPPTNCAWRCWRWRKAVGGRRAWRETGGCGPLVDREMRPHPSPRPSGRPVWLGEVGQCIAWAFLDSIESMGERMKRPGGTGVAAGATTPISLATSLRTGRRVQPRRQGRTSSSPVGSTHVRPARIHASDSPQRTPASS